MNRWIRSSFFSALLILLAAFPALAGGPPRDILGVSVGMPYEEAQARLSKNGEQTSGTLGAGGGKIAWRLNDKRYSHAVVRYNKSHTVEWMTVFAAESGKAVSYKDIGNLDQARLQGHYFYSWNCVRRDGTSYVVRAAGTDSEKLQSLSMYRLGSAFKEVAGMPEKGSVKP